MRHGFDQVTLDRIADDCDVSVRTILRYFVTKERLALAIEHDRLDRFRDGIAQRDVDAVTYWRQFVAEGMEQLADTHRGLRRYLTMVFDHPALFSEFLAVTHAYEEILSKAIEEDSGASDPLGAGLLATILIAGNSAIARRWVMTDEPIDPAVLGKVVDYAVEVFSPTARRRPSRSASR